MALKFEDVSKAIQAAVKEVLGKNSFNEIVKELGETVRIRTQLGYGVAKTEAPRQRLKPLSESYKEQRKGKAYYFQRGGKTIRVETPKGSKPSDLSSKTSPSKSNLTYTSQMLDSVEGKATGFGSGTIKTTGTRRDGVRNEKIAEYVTEQGRPFLNLSNTEINQLKSEIKNRLIASIEKKLTK